MNKTQAGYLLSIAYYLKTEVQDEKFNMYEWAKLKYGVTLDHSGILSQADLEASHPCKTAACVAGHATNVLPRMFRLSVEKDPFPPGYNIKLQVNPDGGRWRPATQNSLAECFGITPDESASIFFWFFDYGPKQKAEQIERLVAEYGYEYAD